MSSTPDRAFNSAICFTDRSDAGEQLANAVVQEIAARPVAAAQLIVYALPRGGLAVAAPIARQLHCPLDVVVAKKITRPENAELAIGAVTSDGQVLWLPQPRLRSGLAQVDETALDQARERAQKQWQQFESNRPQTTAKGAIALVVDDGIATGMTMAVAVQALRAQNAAEVWICVPVAPPEILPHLQSWADRVLVLATPSPFHSVSRFYQEFHQVETAAAIACLRAANEEPRENSL